MFAQVNSISIFYTKAGTGTPVLLLHGNGEDHHIFDALAAKLAHNHTVYAIDSRNHGESDKTEDYSYQTMAQDIAAFIQNLQLAPVNLLGFSDGAIVGLMVAMQQPQLVRKMALLGVNLKPEDFTEESLAYLQQAYQATPTPLLRLMLEQPSIELEEVAKVNTPTLLVAAQDDIFKPESFTRLAAAMPAARLLIMPGHDHSSYINGTDMLYKDIAGFFG